VNRIGEAACALSASPDSDYVGLRGVLKARQPSWRRTPRHDSRAIGKPAFILTPDVVAALVREGVVTRAPTGKRDLALVQAAFNQWAEESGRDLTAISRTLAMSVDQWGGDDSSNPAGAVGQDAVSSRAPELGGAPTNSGRRWTAVSTAISNSYS